ncbi:monocarboxylate transporter 2-like [Salvelinus sp. IW2-2015]|uniref:monocarboxylate transporter 2-like n=1 Tax=Salvelinus sp. IW2-2015 TaxID=2691554 RepID=UPI0038D3F1D1
MPPPAAGPPAVTPPDGGWGWAVVLGSFISIGFSYAFPKAITVYFKDIQKIFDCSYSQIAWISSIMLAVMYAGGVDEYSAAFLLSILAFVDMFARPSMGLLANSKWIRPRIQYFFSFAVLYNGVCHILCPLVESYTGLVVYAVFFGFAFGMVSSVLFETLMDLVGAQRFSSAVGLTTIVECCPVLIGPPLAGKLVDITKNYKYMYFCCGAVVIMASIWLFIGNFINYRLLAKERKQEEMYKRTETEDPDRDHDQKETDGDAQALEDMVDPKDEDAMQRETNI